MTMHRASRASRALLTSDQFAELVVGPDVNADKVPAYYQGFAGDRDAMRRAWLQHREAIMSWCEGGEYSTPEALDGIVDRVAPWHWYHGPTIGLPWAATEFDERRA